MKREGEKNDKLLPLFVLRQCDAPFLVAPPHTHHHHHHPSSSVPPPPAAAPIPVSLNSLHSGCTQTNGLTWPAWMTPGPAGRSRLVINIRAFSNGGTLYEKREETERESEVEWASVKC